MALRKGLWIARKRRLRNIRNFVNRKYPTQHGWTVTGETKMSEMYLKERFDLFSKMANGCRKYSKKRSRKSKKQQG